MTEPNTDWATPEPGPAAEPAPPAVPATPPRVPSTGPAASARRTGGVGLANALLLVGVLVAVGGLAFAGGRITAPRSAGGFARNGGQVGLPGASFGAGQGGVPGASFQPGQGGPGGFGGDRSVTITGTVKQVDGSTLVITTANGTETTIDVGSSTYHRQGAASAADVTPGATVQVQVQGFGFRRPDASAAPGAGGAPGSGTITATDVTLTGN